MNTKRDYDHTKLKIWFEKKVPVSEFTELVGRVYSYDNSERKVKILSEIERGDGQKRIVKQCPPMSTPEHVEQVMLLLDECKQHL